MVEENKQQPFSSSSSIPNTINQLSSLILLSHSIKPFSSKWKLISSKLHLLNSILTSLQPPIPPSPILNSILNSIQETLNSSTMLAHTCIHHSFSGKLLMQSDLDIIFSKFDALIAQLSELVNSDGFFSSNPNSAIVVSKPSPSASREDVKFYVKDLLSRFKIGRIEMKKQALVSLAEVVQEDERYVKIAMEIDGFVHVLMKFLNSKEVGIQEVALKSIVVICGFDSYKSILVEIGIVGMLIRVLESGSELGKELSARCLMKVTANSDNAWAVSAHGGSSALLKICCNGCDDGAGGGGELVGLCCGVLRNLIGVDEIKRFVVEEGAIPMSLKLVKSRNEASQLSAIDFVHVMACGNEYVRGLIVNEGGIRVLVRVLDPKSWYSSKAREKAVRAIMSVCSDSIGCINSLRSYGFMDHVLHFLHDGEVSVQESALRAASWMCGFSDEFKKAMGDAGFIPEIVKFLDAKSFEAREIAAETLSKMVVVPRNQKRFVQNDQNVNFILQLISDQNGDCNNNRKHLLSIVMSLTMCNDGRKKILSSGYLKNIERLAEEDQVLDAKKIVRNLSSNRFRSMIRGIWHS